MEKREREREREREKRIDLTSIVDLLLLREFVQRKRKTKRKRGVNIGDGSDLDEIINDRQERLITVVIILACQLLRRN